MKPKYNPLIILITGFPINMVRAYFFIYLPILVNNQAGSSELALSMSIAGALSLIFSFSGGLIADSLGRKPMAVLSVFSMIPTLGLLLMKNPLAIMLSLILFHSIGIFFSPGTTALIAESTEEKIRGRVFSLVHVSSTVAWIIGPMLTNWIIKKLGFVYVLYVVLVMLFILSLFRLMLVETLPKKRPLNGVTSEIKKNIISSIKNSDFRKLLNTPLAPLALLFCLSAFISSCFNTFLYPYLDSWMKLDSDVIVNVFSASRFFVLVAYFVAGFMVDYLSPKKTFIVDILGDSITMTLFALLSKYAPTYSLIFLALSGLFGEALSNIAYSVYTSKHQKEYLATAYGTLNTLPGLIGIFAPVIWGALWRVDPWLTILAVSMMTFVGLFFAIMVKE
ncbi:MFS transporter [Thermococcus litoralis DSM 5473]|uniref:MFS transporter n=1 Tax=Thermococcus litoralis (strain ATCC 51850 / DSM 5473 / JCM 8560 / NS-C) TaxID=523849 RepID=H3ZNY5_THELN|nr:MFS transporter [Thermococcus litoralis DSM 5473]